LFFDNTFPLARTSFYGFLIDVCVISTKHI
jgi:hypothetical protein